MIQMKKPLLYSTLFLALASCQGDIQVDQQLKEDAHIFPDYKEVTIPGNIAPLNFQLMDAEDVATQLIVKAGGQSFQVAGKEGVFDIPEKKWKEMLKQQEGKDIELIVCKQQGNKWCAYTPFLIHVAPDEIDPYLAYRLIAPGYSPWDNMGIYQRNLETFEQKAIYENKVSDMNCVNCHNFQMQNPEKMVMHMRAKHGGTIVLDHGKIEKINTKTPETISSLVYPGWHPTEDFVAFSTNFINQVFFMSHANRLEGFDRESDVVVYNAKTHELIASPFIKSQEAFETYPTFSPDGKYLYFCTAKAIDPMPDRYKEAHYNICRIGFDAKTQTFANQVDTVYNAERDSLSTSFPRISPDGKYLAFVRQQYGQWSIWHKDADLCLIDLQNGNLITMDDANSKDSESYHSWSHNSRWMVFSSRRDDGLYTKPYFTYIDANGKAHKPFLLPQKNPKKYYDDLMMAYNIPELITGPVQIDERSLSDKMITDPGINTTFHP